MSIFLDQFNSDPTWVKVGSWVDSTYSISGGLNTLTAGTNAATSAWTRSGFEGLNASITVKAGPSTNGIPQIHLRESSSGNYLVVYLNPADNSLHIGKVSSGTYTEFDSVASSITSGGTFTFTAKVYGNCLYGGVQSNDGTGTVFKDLKYISSDVSAYTGTFHGIGVTSGTQKYDWVDMRILTRFTNVLCVGDSNVGADNRLYWPNLLLARHFNEGFVSENQGLSGKATQWFLDHEATTIDPFFITGVGVDNVLSIATGNNDFAVYDLTAAQAYAKQLDLMAYAKPLGWRIELATLIPFPYAGDPLTFVTDLNVLIRAGASIDGFTLCEIHNAFGAVDGVAGTSPSGLTESDLIHYTTASGHPLAAKTHSYSLTSNHRNPVT